MTNVLLWTLLLFQGNQQLPTQYYELPAEVRAKATLTVRGTYGTGRTPCIMRPDGTRVWFKDSWFNVEQIYAGQVTTKSVRINTAMMPKSNYLAALNQGREYLVLLKPTTESQELLTSEAGPSFWQSLNSEEIVAIIDLSK